MTYPSPVNYNPDKDNWLRQISTILSGVMLGRTNNVSGVTLTANQASTTVTLSTGKINSNSGVFLTPTTANAAAEIGAGTLYVTVNSSSNNFVITHANNAQTDRTFKYSIIG